MKLSEAKAKGFELRDLKEGEFYTKDIYQITNISDCITKVESNILGIIPEEELYLDINPNEIKDGVYDSDLDFVYKNIPSSFPLPSYDSKDNENEVFIDFNDPRLNIEYDNENNITEVSFNSLNNLQFEVENVYDTNYNLETSIYITNGSMNDMNTAKSYKNNILDRISYVDSHISKYYETIKDTEGENNILHINKYINEFKDDLYAPIERNTKNIDIIYNDYFDTPELYVRYDQDNQIDGMISVEYTNEGPLQQAKTMQLIQVQNDDYFEYLDSDMAILDIFR